MNEIIIRPLAESEIESLGKLAHEIWHAHYPAIISREQIDFMLGQRYSTEAIRGNLSGQHWLVAWRDRSMVGFAHSLADDAPGSWKLDKLYVHPSFQRAGIGQALLQATVEQVRQAGGKRLVLRVNRHNEAALAAYAKYGFRVYGEHVLDIGNGFVMDDFLLEMDLCS